ncbi:hypothetical protein MKX03_035022 [Papaver bracteatum]|nr:hypothetical protein MKX03_035022 [Papaver bracteatum]
MCIIAVRKEGKNVLINVIGTLDFRGKYLLQGETYPEVLWICLAPSRKEGHRNMAKSNVTVAKSACQQGVGGSMLKFAIETAKEDGETASIRAVD